MLEGDKDVDGFDYDYDNRCVYSTTRSHNTTYKGFTRVSVVRNPSDLTRSKVYLYLSIPDGKVRSR